MRLTPFGILHLRSEGVKKRLHDQTVIINEVCSPPAKASFADTVLNNPGKFSAKMVENIKKLRGQPSPVAHL